MMGRTHSLSGAAAWLVAAPAISAYTGPLSTGQTLSGAALCAGGAMIPDLDMHGSTIGRTYGPITNGVARVVAFISGGHRNGTHSLVGITVFTLIGYTAATAGGWWAGIVCWILLGVGARGLDIGLSSKPGFTALVHAVFMAGVVFALAGTDVDVSRVLPWVLGIGAATHIAGDLLTREGCPLMWPLSRYRFGVLWLRTDGPVERWILWPVLFIAVIWLAWTVPDVADRDATGVHRAACASVGPHVHSGGHQARCR
jgi:membrane-bound metal-dependent hydrolase YbcI (DUF457 family)